MGGQGERKEMEGRGELTLVNSARAFHHHLSLHLYQSQQGQSGTIIH